MHRWHPEITDMYDLKRTLPMIDETPNLVALLRANDFDKKTGKAVCDKCEGDKVCYDWADRDCNEGWKMADKKPCEKCHATGRIDVQIYLDLFTIRSERYNKQVDLWNKSAKDLNAIRMRLPLKLRKPLGLEKGIAYRKKVEQR